VRDDTIYVRGDSITFSTSIHFTDSKIQILDGNTGAGISAYADFTSATTPTTALDSSA
jgi:hypothetical protein